MTLRSRAPVDGPFAGSFERVSPLSWQRMTVLDVLAREAG